MRTAIVNVADTGPLESIVVMLRSIGYQCCLPDPSVRAKLRETGCDTVLDIKGLVDNWGYEHPFRMTEADLGDMKRKDVVFIDVKAHRNKQYIVKEWPNLESRVLWYRINGSKPEHVIRADGFDCGDEVNPPCPILTPNQWYRYPYRCEECGWIGNSGVIHCPNGHMFKPSEWWDRAYTCYPPFYRFDAYYPVHGRDVSTDKSTIGYDPPVCLIHNLQGWGYGALVDNMHKLGVKCYGGRSPDGLIPHKQIPYMLSRAVCMVHLKSNDAPGYALYEALAAACPVVCTRRLIWRCRMEDLYISQRTNIARAEGRQERTCLTFDRETHDSLSPVDVERCTEEVREHLQTLQDPVENARIGMAGRARLKELMWSEARESDTTSLREFMGRHFG